MARPTQEHRITDLFNIFNLLNKINIKLVLVDTFLSRSYQLDLTERNDKNGFVENNKPIVKNHNTGRFKVSLVCCKYNKRCWNSSPMK